MLSNKLLEALKLRRLVIKFRHRRINLKRKRRTELLDFTFDGEFNVSWFAQRRVMSIHKPKYSCKLRSHQFVQVFIFLVHKFINIRFELVVIFWLDFHVLSEDRIPTQVSSFQLCFNIWWNLFFSNFVVFINQDRMIKPTLILLIYDSLAVLTSLFVEIHEFPDRSIDHSRWEFLNEIWLRSHDIVGDYPIIIKQDSEIMAINNICHHILNLRYSDQW